MLVSFLTYIAFEKFGGPQKVNICYSQVSSGLGTGVLSAISSVCYSSLGLSVHLRTFTLSN